MPAAAALRQPSDTTVMAAPTASGALMRLRAQCRAAASRASLLTAHPTLATNRRGNLQLAIRGDHRARGGEQRHAPVRDRAPTCPDRRPIRAVAPSSSHSRRAQRPSSGSATRSSRKYALHLGRDAAASVLGTTAEQAARLPTSVSPIQHSLLRASGWAARDRITLSAAMRAALGLRSAL